MNRHIKNIILLVFITTLLQGCAGLRESYRSQLEKSGDKSVLYVKKGEKVELLAVGDGFPGRWGYMRWVMSAKENIASVECKEQRSLIPFREPGVIFGGTVCNLIAHQAGKTTLFFGNKYNLSEDTYEEKVEAIVIDN